MQASFETIEMKILLVIVAGCLGLTLQAADARIWLDATVNGQRVRLVFDTGATDSALFRRTAERLKLKVTDPPPNYRPGPGMVRTGLTEPVDFTCGTLTVRTSLRVIDFPKWATDEVEGLLSWNPLRSNVLVFDATSLRVDVGGSLPARALAWPKFKLRSDAQILGFDVGGYDPRHGTVYLDTGMNNGVALNRALWARWAATRTRQPATMTAFITPVAGIVVKKELWADQISLGSLVLNDVPVQEFDIKTESPALPNHAATLGLFALHRLDLVVDGSNAVVYARPAEGPAPAYPHNQLGAVFAPQDLQSEPLVAHVAAGSPAFLAGIRDKDVLLKIDGLDVTKWQTDPRVMPLSRFWERPAGTAYTLTLQRGKREYETKVVLKQILGSVQGMRAAGGDPGTANAPPPNGAVSD